MALSNMLNRNQVLHLHDSSIDKAKKLNYKVTKLEKTISIVICTENDFLYVLL